MTDQDLRLRSAGEASELQSEILAAAAEGVAKRADGEQIAARALANALVAVVQQYLRGHSSAEDVELFFEVHGRAPVDDPAAWPANILADLSRHQIPAQDMDTIRQSAVATAVRYIRSASPLAWG